MIAGVGIDMVSISRMTEKMSKPEFKRTVFTEHEIQYCEAAHNSAQHFSARFAVKEAFLKAVGKGMEYDSDVFHQIEVYHEPGGQPAVRLTGSYQTIRQTEHWAHIHVSITHEGDYAMAIVILEK